MGFTERNVWAQLGASVLALAAYAAIVLPQLATRTPEAVQWVSPMIGSILGAIILSILGSLAWGTVVGLRDREAATATDQRDRDIDDFGDRIGQAFLVLGALAGLVLAMLDLDRFWIGNAIFLGFFLSAVVGGAARLVAYRRGLR